MLKNRKQNRRLLIMLVAIVGLAIVGLFAINVQQAQADRNPVGQITDMESGSATPGSLTDNAKTESGVFGAMVKMVSALVLVLVAVYAGLYLLKRLMNRRHGGVSCEDALEVLKTVYLGPRKTVSLIKVADRSVLVGVTDHQVSMLTELDAEETARALATTSETPRAESFESFGHVLKTASAKIGRLNLRRKGTVLES